MSIHKSGLYVVATPIGNLADMSLRAQEVLAAVDVIAAEDTRHTRHLLNHYGIRTNCVSLHDHNEHEVVPALLARLQAGGCVAVVSDAGTPLLSDPGFLLVRESRRLGIAVMAVPGPSAITAALSISGLPAVRFAFEGFLPPKSTPRQARLRELVHEQRTLIFFEVPHRIVEALDDINLIFGAAREIALMRELTKVHEQVIFGLVGEVLERVRASADDQRGEMVLIVRGAPPVDVQEIEIQRVLALLLSELPLKPAAMLAAQIVGCGRNQAYQVGLSLRSPSSDET